MAISGSTMLEWLFWCLRNDPEGNLDYPTAARLFNEERVALKPEKPEKPEKRE